MIKNKITDSDMIILNSVESYLKSINAPMCTNPAEKMYIYQQARDYLYSDIAQRLPRVATYISEADLESDNIAQGLCISLSKHMLDPVFINILMQYLARNNNSEDNCMVGALLAKLLNKWLEQNVVSQPTETKTKDKDNDKDKKKETNKSNPLDQIGHIKTALDQLLGSLAGMISTRCGNLTIDQALAIAAAVAMNNSSTIKEIIASDFAITADIFDVVKDPSNLIKYSLLMEKNDIPGKLTNNQNTFVESLKRWVYKKLNEIPTQSAYQFLVAVYGYPSGIDVSTKLINIKECGTQYSNLLTIAKQMINK